MMATAYSSSITIHSAGWYQEPSSGMPLLTTDEYEQMCARQSVYFAAQGTPDSHGTIAPWQEDGLDYGVWYARLREYVTDRTRRIREMEQRLALPRPVTVTPPVAALPSGTPADTPRTLDAWLTANTLETFEEFTGSPLTLKEVELARQISEITS